MRYYYFVLLLFSVIWGCNNKTNDARESIPTYKVDLNKAEEVSINDIFSRVDIIPLTTPDSIVCGGIHSYVYKNNVFLWDQQQDFIVCFDTLGNYRRTINAKGRGPAEYMDILSIAIDYYNDYIMVLDFDGMLQFDFYGNFIKKTRYPSGLIVHYATMINPDTMFCVTVASHDEDAYKINYLSLKESKILASCYRENPMFPVNYLISHYNGKQYYVIPKTSVIYGIENLELTPLYRWDFGEYDYNYEDLSIPRLEEKELQKIQRTWISKNCPWLMGYVEENSTYLYAELSFCKKPELLKTPPYHIFWNKKTKEYKVVSNFKEGNVFLPFSSWGDHAVYAAVEPSAISRFISMDALTPENREIVENLPEDANPVLLKYIFK